MSATVFAIIAEQQMIVEVIRIWLQPVYVLPLLCPVGVLLIVCPMPCPSVCSLPPILVAWGDDSSFPGALFALKGLLAALPSVIATPCDGWKALQWSWPQGSGASRKSH